jgi:hypothetical protein
METKTINKHDFKKFLLEKLNDTRQEELILWKKGIPLPIDLLYRIFDQKGELLKIYLDHISSAYLYSKIIRLESQDYNLLMLNQPNALNLKLQNTIYQQFDKFYSVSNVSELALLLAEKLFIFDYKFTKESYFKAICHEGRKYKRLYLPQKIKETIGVFDSQILEFVGISNGDMFGNIVADFLGVYRSGFSDAFAAIFNKLLDYILEKPEGKITGYSSSINIRISQPKDPQSHYENFNSGKVEDGSLWEPKYTDAKSSFILNNRHPYFELINRKSGLEVLVDIASQAAIIENETIKDSTSSILESFRKDISRKLRLVAERNEKP